MRGWRCGRAGDEQLRFDIRDGRVAAMEESVEDLDAWRAFWA
jgi:hypothetical protein